MRRYSVSVVVALAVAFVIPLSACAAIPGLTPTPQCTLADVDEVIAQLNGGHNYPTDPSPLTQSRYTDEEDQLCSGDYAVSLGSNPYPTSIIIVRGNPVQKVSGIADPATASNYADANDYYKELGADVIIVGAVNLSSHPNETNLYAIEYTSGYNASQG